jgi:hypothetical protein
VHDYIGGTTPFAPTTTWWLDQAALASFMQRYEDDGAGDQVLHGGRRQRHDRRAVRDGDLLFLAVVGTVTVWPSTPLTALATVAFVMLLFGFRSQP